MHDCCQYGPRSVADVGVLPVEGNTVYGAWPVPEAKGAAGGWYGYLLVEGAVARGFSGGGAACVSRLGAGVSEDIGDVGSGG